MRLRHPAPAPGAVRRAVIRALVISGVLAATVVVSPAVATDAEITRVSAVFSATRVTVNKRVTVTGTMRDDLTGAAVTLERAMPGGRWHRESAPVTITGRTFRLHVPTWWFGTRTYRVRVLGAAGTAPVVYPETTTVRVDPPYTPQGRADAHRLWTWGGRVSRWNPCRRIGYRVNLHSAPADALADVKEAVGRVSQATGLRFTYLGTTAKVPTNDNSYGDADVLVAWRTPTQYPFGDAIAVGPRHAYPGYRTTGGKPVNAITHGAVILNSAFNVRIPHGFGPGSRGELLMHELGHVVGLDHAPAMSQVMYRAVEPTSLARYGAGDLAGLDLVGANQGCLVPQ